MIKKITIEIDGKELKLTPEQAQELLSDLKQMFPDPVVIPSTPVVVEKPYNPYTPRWDYFPTTCRSYELT